MTLEEAAERVLRGGPWFACKACNGVGNDRTLTEAYRRAVRDAPFGEGPNPPNPNRYRKDCEHCNGEGVVIEPKYREACEVLGLPLPSGRLEQLIELRTE